MKELNQALLEELEQLALMGCEAIRAALTDHNNDPMTYRKAKVGTFGGDEFYQRASGRGQPSGDGGCGCPTATAIALGGPQEC
jgi:hypothetical protein